MKKYLYFLLLCPIPLSKFVVLSCYPSLNPFLAPTFSCLYFFPRILPFLNSYFSICFCLFCVSSVHPIFGNFSVIMFDQQRVSCVLGAGFNFSIPKPGHNMQVSFSKTFPNLSQSLAVQRFIFQCSGANKYPTAASKYPTSANFPKY